MPEPTDIPKDRAHPRESAPFECAAQCIEREFRRMMQTLASMSEASEADERVSRHLAAIQGLVERGHAMSQELVEIAASKRR